MKLTNGSFKTQYQTSEIPLRIGKDFTFITSSPSSGERCWKEVVVEGMDGRGGEGSHLWHGGDRWFVGSVGAMVDLGKGVAHL